MLKYRALRYSLLSRARSPCTFLYHHRRLSFATMSLSSTHPRRFSPLNSEKEVDGERVQLQGIVFDVDGTLW